MLASPITPLINLTSQLTDTPASTVQDIVDFQYKFLKDYSQGNLDVRALSFSRLGRFSPSKHPLRYLILSYIRKSRKNPVYKEKLSAL